MRDSFGRRERSRRVGRRLLVWTVLGGLILGVGWTVWGGTGGPRAKLVRPLSLVGKDTPLDIDLHAGRSGLRDFEITALRPDGTRVLLAAEQIPAAGFLGSGVTHRRVQLTIDAAALGLPEGPAQIEVHASDYAPIAFLRGRKPLLQVPVTIDRTPPRIRVRGGSHYVSQGGSDLVVYEVDPDTAESGVQVGDRSFPGYHPPKLPPHLRVALYAIPHDAAPTVQPRLIAVDAAGNQQAVGFPVEVRARRFPTERIRVTDEFIESTVRPLLEAAGWAAPGDPVEAFLAVNRRMRRTSEERLRELVARSGPSLAITGAFRQQPGTQVGSRFAEHRTYLYGDRVIDQQDHLGYDLASVRQTPVFAAQAGTVRAVTDLGIYGHAVLLDHGLGLFSLYAHLSSAEVSEGQAVDVGDPIGRSGQTGLAAGDHLHFSVLVGGEHVDPIEWWDPNWVRLHVLEPLAQVGRGG